MNNREISSENTLGTDSTIIQSRVIFFGPTQSSNIDIIKGTLPCLFPMKYQHYCNYLPWTIKIYINKLAAWPLAPEAGSKLSTLTKGKRDRRIKMRLRLRPLAELKPAYGRQ